MQFISQNSIMNGGKKDKNITKKEKEKIVAIKEKDTNVNMVSDP